MDVVGLKGPLVDTNVDGYRDGELLKTVTDSGSRVTLDFRDSFRRSSVTNIVQVQKGVADYFGEEKI